MRSLLTVDEKADRVIGLSHALVLQSCSHVLSTVDVPVVLKRLSVKSDIS